MDSQTTTNSDVSYREALHSLIEDESLTLVEKFENFPKYCSRQYLSYYLAKYEIFKKVLKVHGSIIECGVFQGGGLMWWAQLSAILEPFNHQRRIIGFDTFSGFKSLTSEDLSGAHSSHHIPGGLATNAQSEILSCIDVFDSNRPISHIPKVELVIGDATETIPHYIETHPHLVISLLVLDMDVYEPSLTALKYFLPRMSSGSIIWLDEINAPQWPGETQALLESVDLQNLEIRRFPFESHAAYAILK